MATIHDVAKHAGVSISTVSYVLNGKRPISETTRQRVLAAMKELQYRPYPHARALSSKESHMLALFIPPTRRGLGETEIDFASHLSREALREGYHTLLITDEYDDMRTLKEFIHQGLVDGIILMEVHTPDPRIPYLLDSRMPFVIVGRCEGENLNCNWVDIDFEKTLFAAVQYFMEREQRHLAFVNQSEEVFKTGYGPVVRSFEAFERAQRIFSYESFLHYFCEANPTAGYELTKTILNRQPALQALIIMNDRALPGIYRALYESQKRIPHDVSILSMVTSGRAAEMLYPPVSTLEFPAPLLATQTVQYLISKIRGKNDIPLHNTVVCPLVERGSTKGSVKGITAGSIR